MGKAPIVEPRLEPIFWALSSSNCKEGAEGDLRFVHRTLSSPHSIGRGKDGTESPQEENSEILALYLKLQLLGDDAETKMSGNLAHCSIWI